MPLRKAFPLAAPHSQQSALRTGGITVGEAHLSDVGGGTMRISCEWEFLVAGPNSPTALQERGDRVMSSLLDLESADPRLADGAVSLDTGKMTMTIGLVVVGSDYEETVAHALASIRTAIHAAGGATPDWPSHDGDLEPQGFRAAAM